MNVANLLFSGHLPFQKHKAGCVFYFETHKTVKYQVARYTQVKIVISSFRKAERDFEHKFGSMQFKFCYRLLEVSRLCRWFVGRGDLLAY